ncbi:MAG: toxin-antitoxin system HicB family antitoxin [Pseudomonadota bacterium]
MSDTKSRVRTRKAIMIRPDPELLAAMQAAAEREGISLNKLALEIIETSGRLGTSVAAGTRAELRDAVTEIERAVRRLRSTLN